MEEHDEEATDQQQQQQQQKWLQVVEALLEAALRFISGAADVADRILGSNAGSSSSSAASTGSSSGGDGGGGGGGSRSWWWMRAIRWLGNGVRGLFLGLTLLPTERSTLWVVSVLLLVVCFLLVGYRSNFRLVKIVEEVEVPKTAVPTSSKRLFLPDGRSISYKEHGVAAQHAKHSGLILRHSVDKVSGSHHINETLLEEFGVRLVCYDLPGFGRSEPNYFRNFESCSQDMVSIANALGFGERFWLLVYAGGGPYAWAAIKYIPARLAGVVMFGPLENNPLLQQVPWTEAASPLVQPEKQQQSSRLWDFVLFFARYLPRYFTRLFLDSEAVSSEGAQTRNNKSAYATVPNEQQDLFEQREFIAFWEQHLRQSQIREQQKQQQQQQESDKSGKARDELEETRQLVKRGGGLVSFRLPMMPSLRRLFGLVSSFAAPKQQRPKAKHQVKEAVNKKEARGGGATNNNSLWDAFKRKLSVVGIVIAILLLVLR